MLNQYHVRAGEIDINTGLITHEGTIDICTSAQWIIGELMARCVYSITIICSQSLGACQTAAILCELLMQPEIVTIIDLGPTSKLDPPFEGESASDTGARCAAATLNCSDGSEALVVVYDSGSIEPTILSLTGDRFDRLPTGAVVPVVTKSRPTFKPNAMFQTTQPSQSLRFNI